MNIEWVGSPNFSSREGRKPIAIVDHITQGLMPGCLNWLKNPVAQASAHYLVTRDGRILQLVKDENKAWHAGGVSKCTWPLYDGTNPNLYTIGIEHEGMTGEPLTEAQYQATLYLHRFLMGKWGIPADTNHIIGHYRIDGVNRPNCPGSAFPWDRLFKDLQTPATPAPAAPQKPIIGRVNSAVLPLDANIGPSVIYQGHVENVGWQNVVANGEMIGTTGEGLRLEALRVELENAPGAHIKAMVHVQNIGWMPTVQDGGLAGTQGKALRIEAVKLFLEGLPGYSIQYQAHVQNQGWQDWVADGAQAGTTGQSLRLEALRIKLVKK